MPAICNAGETNYWSIRMATGWTSERRARQAQAVQQWRPWEHSTGPRTADGKSRSARNADKGGEWRELREMVKTLNQAMRQHRQILRKLAR
jgi:hypothetical protein